MQCRNLQNCTKALFKAWAHKYCNVNTVKAKVLKIIFKNGSFSCEFRVCTEVRMRSALQNRGRACTTRYNRILHEGF